MTFLCEMRARFAYYQFYYELCTCISMLEPWEKRIANAIVLMALCTLGVCCRWTMPVCGQMIGVVLQAIDRTLVLDAMRCSIWSS